MTGMFITLEGPEGAGKSTNLSYLANKIEKAGREVVITREPGGTPLSEEIRELLISSEFKGMSVNTELLLMFAARSEHFQQIILPALEKNKVVICDRFTDATYAYQGGGRGIDTSKIALLETMVQGEIRPNLTLLFDLPAEIGLERVRKSRDGLDRFEQEDLHFFEAVRNAYKKRAALYPDIFYMIDASQPIENVQLQLDKFFINILDCLNA